MPNSGETTHYNCQLNSVTQPEHTDELNEKLPTRPHDQVSWTAENFSNYRKKLKSGKAAGIDGLSAEHFKYASTIIDVHLALVYNALVCHSFLPDSFMPVRIVPIVKNATGVVSSRKNYRPIAIATTGSKLFELAILDKVDSIPNIPEHNQFGFREKSSTDQCILLLKERIRHYVKLEGPVYCCFLDASKAFDRVCHDTLFLQLINYGIPTSVVKILKFWYSHQTMNVSWNGCTSEGLLEMVCVRGVFCIGTQCGRVASALD